MKGLPIPSYRAAQQVFPGGVLAPDLPPEHAQARANDVVRRLPHQRGLEPDIDGHLAGQEVYKADLYGKLLAAVTFEVRP